MEAIERLVDGLTEPQRAAVEHVDGPLLVLAGPGSGKTTVVARRIAYLVNQGIPAWQILALTFTNKAAGEMRDRADRLVPADAPGRSGLTVATFHALCARVLRRYADAVGISPRYSIYQTDDQRAAIKLAIREADLNERNFSPSSVASMISGAKNRLLDAALYAQEAGDFYSRGVARAYTAYERILRANDALDFDDLLLLTARLLRTDAGARRDLVDRYRYVLVDEYQDTNHAQFVIAGALAEEHRNLCVVGDPDQSIYGWRGADIRNILDFEQQYPEAVVIPLGQNFRSTGHIVRAADELIRHNTQRKHKTLHTELGEGEKPRIFTCRDERSEAKLVADLLREQHLEDERPWREMAVLYRINALSRVLEEALRDAQIPYVIARGTAFYDREEVRHALAYLRLLVNPNDELAIRRIVNTPTRGIGRTTIDRVDCAATAHGTTLAEALRHAASIPALSSRAVNAIEGFVRMLEDWRASAERTDDATSDDLARLVERVVQESGLERHYANKPGEEDLERVQNLEELINAAAQFEPRVDDLEPEPNRARTWTLLERLAAFLESVALVSDADAIDPANGAVTLLTLHAAKGLEFDVVCMVGLEEGVLPMIRAMEESNIEEERRLCFVGMTRARRHLALSRAVVRTHRGRRERTAESVFLGELPADGVTRLDLAGEETGPRFDADGWDEPAPDPYGDFGSGAAGRTVGGFTAGDVVRHPTFGLGRIDAVMPQGRGSRARVTFQHAGTKILILEYARLERVDEVDLADY